MDYEHVAEGGGEGDVGDFASWDEERLGLFFRRKGLGAYEGAFAGHKITGRLAPHLTDEDLKEVGVDVVGDRLAIKLCLKELARGARFRGRVEPLWEGHERLFSSECERATATCCGLCPVDPSAYSLTTSHLRVKRVRPVRCGPIRLCCLGVNYTSNNIDLSKVDDVDVIGIPAPCLQRACFCAGGIERVEVESRFEKGGKVSLTLDEGRGEHVAHLILNQVEESQKMERG